MSDERKKDGLPENVKEQTVKQEIEGDASRIGGYEEQETAPLGLEIEDAANADVNEATEGKDAPQAEVEERKQRKKVGTSIAASFQTRKFRGGAYAMLLSVIVIVLVIVVNMLATELNWTIDLTSDGKYSLTDETKEFARAISDEITLYYLAQSGAETPMIQKIVEQYDGLGKHMSLVYKDPVQYPKFLSGYVDYEGTLNGDAILVVNEANGRAKLVTYSEMILQSIDYSTYETSYTIDVEGQLDSALQYVTNENLPKLYQVTGHGEIALGTELLAMLSKENVTVDSLDTLTAEAVPEDCDLLFINQPTYDYAAEEVTMLKTWLAAGGNAIITANFNTNGLPNFAELLSYYGVLIVDGYVVEQDSGYFTMNNLTYLLPAIATHEITDGIKGRKRVVAPISVGLTARADMRNTITLTPLLTTSDNAFSRVNMELSATTKQDSDIAGPFDVMLLAEEVYNGVETKLLVIGVMDYFAATSTNYGNIDLFLNTINYMAGVESSLSIRTQSAAEAESISMTSEQVYRNMIIYMVVIPVLLIGIGIVVVARRRRK